MSDSSSEYYGVSIPPPVCMFACASDAVRRFTELDCQHTNGSNYVTIVVIGLQTDTLWNAGGMNSKLSELLSDSLSLSNSVSLQRKQIRCHFSILVPNRVFIVTSPKF